MNPIDVGADGWIPLGSMQAGSAPVLALQLAVAPSAAAAGEVRNLLQVEAQWITPTGEPQQLEALLRLPVVDPASWAQLPVDPEVQQEVLLQEAARQRRLAMDGIDRGDVDSSRSSVQAALQDLQQAPASPETEREQLLLQELLDLIGSDKLTVARKVMSSQAFMRARSRRVRNQDGRAD